MAFDRSVLKWILIDISIVLAVMYLYIVIGDISPMILALALMLIGVLSFIDVLAFKVVPKYVRERRVKEVIYTVTVLGILAVIFMLIMMVYISWVV